jgi:hypothetical protein
MTQTTGTTTANLMDQPLNLGSVFTPFVGDNGYKWTGNSTVQIISTPDGSLSTYTETSITPITVGLVGTTLTSYTVAYNQAMFQRIQATLVQDIPVANFAANWAKQQIGDIFIPAHDVYSINKVELARNVGNDVTATYTSGAWATTGLSLAFGQAFLNMHKYGAAAGSTIAWVADSFANALVDQISFGGSDVAWNGVKNSAYLGQWKGVSCVAVPDTYFTLLGATSQLKVGVLMADKRAIINVAPKMAPTDYKVITDISGFSGVEIQIRDRGDTFVLTNKVNNIAMVRQAGTIS